MKEQSDLFSYPRGPGWTEPTTSRTAAEMIRPHVGKQQAVIVRWLLSRGSVGGTYLEITAGAGVAAQSVCGRMVELVQAGLVQKSSPRPTPSGRPAAVYVATDKARSFQW